MGRGSKRSSCCHSQVYPSGIVTPNPQVNYHAPNCLHRGDIQRQVADGVSRLPGDRPLGTNQEKLRHGITTSEGLTLSLGKNGEVLASVENTANTMAFGYVRRNGAFSRAENQHIIREQFYNQTNRLTAVNQSETFSAQVTHHDGIRTTVALKVDPSVEVLHLKLGQREFLIRASDIKRVESQNAEISATPISSPATVDSPEPRDTSEPIESNANSAAPIAESMRVYDPSYNSSINPVIATPLRSLRPDLAAAGSALKALGNRVRGAIENPGELRGRLVGKAKELAERARSLVRRGGGKATGAVEVRAAPESGGARVVEPVVTRKAPPALAEEPAEAIKIEPRQAPEPAASEGTVIEVKAKPTALGEATALATKANLQLQHSLWRKKLPGSEWAKNNPVRAMTLALVVSESVTGALAADYSDDAEHNPVPSLLKFFSRDIGSSLTFTTEEAGMFASVAAEGASSAGDAVISVAWIKIIEGAGACLLGRTAAGAVMRYAGPLGTAWHGYKTFSDGGFVNMNNTQITGNVASPIALGAALGVPLGPIGMGGGAVIGAAGEAVGFYVGGINLEKEILNNWKQREVREALRLAELGFTLPNDSELVKKRKALKDLPEEHRKFIMRFTQNTTLWHLARIFTTEEQERLGFKSISAKNATDKELAEISQHNVERIVELTEGGSWGSWIWGDFIDQLKAKHPTLAGRFVDLYAEQEKLCKDLFDHSPHVTLTVNDEGVKSSSELPDYIQEVAHGIDLNSTDRVILEKLVLAFPDIDTIMSTEQGRELLINTLEAASGNTGRFRKLLLSSLQVINDESNESDEPEQKPGPDVTPPKREPTEPLGPRTVALAI
jgi:hypothetical protein